MARRYSGDVRISVVWSDRGDHYGCRVITDEGSENVIVRASPELLRTLAVDSSEAYDAIARSALTFAESGLEEQGISLSELALFEPDGSGWLVVRSRR